MSREAQQVMLDYYTMSITAQRQADLATTANTISMTSRIELPITMTSRIELPITTAQANSWLATVAQTKFAPTINSLKQNVLDAAEQVEQYKLHLRTRIQSSDEPMLKQHTIKYNICVQDLLDACEDAE